jgi:hypothetical protein
MINGNDLLVIVGDDALRAQLISQTAGQGASLVSMEGGPTVEVAVTAAEVEILNRVIRVASRTEMKAYDVPAGYQFSLAEGGRSGLFVCKVGSPPTDPQEGIYIVLTNGNYVERINFTILTPEMFGAVGDGVTDDYVPILAALQLYPRLIFGKDKSYFMGTSILYTTFPAGVSLYLDFNGSTILANDPAVVAGSGTVFPIKIEKAVYDEDSRSTIKNLKLDCSAFPHTDSTTVGDKKGFGGIRVVNFGTIEFYNYTGDSFSYTRGIDAQRYHTLKIDGVYFTNVGRKFNPTVSDTSANDSSGDAIYTGNTKENGITDIRNVYAEGWPGKAGRVGVVVETVGGTKHNVTLTNCNFKGFNRTVHQEDTGVATINWQSGIVRDAGIVFYSFGGNNGFKASGLDVADFSSIDFGSAKGVIVQLGTATAKTKATVKDSNIVYSTTSANEYGLTNYINCNVTVSTLGITRNTGGASRIMGGSTTFPSTSGFIVYGNSPTIQFENHDLIADDLRNYIRFVAGGSINITGGIQKNVNINITNGNLNITRYKDTKILVTSNTSGTIFMASSNTFRVFNDVTFSCTLDQPVEISGIPALTNKEYNGCYFDNVILELINDSTIDRTMRMTACTLRMGDNSTATGWFAITNSRIIISATVFMDGNGLSSPPTAGTNVILAGCSIIASDGTISAA